MKKKLPASTINPKIIAIDLDDTLLKDDLTISDYTVAVIQRAIQNQIYIVLCSGRTDNAILPYIRKLDTAGSQFGRYMITQNGTSIFDLHQRIPLYNRFVEPEILIHSYREAARRGISVEIYDAHTIYAPFMTEWLQQDVRLSGLNLKLVADFESLLQTKQKKLVISGDPQKLPALQKKLQDDFGSKAILFTSKPYFLEVMPEDSGKGQALKHLAEEILTIQRENTMCFGDGMNDESMIEYAYLSTAMCNGVSLMQDQARFITEKSNNDDGVAHFIEKYCLAQKLNNGVN